MASEILKRWNITPTVWLIGAIILAFGAGIFIAAGSPWWIFPAISSILSAQQMMQRVMRINKRMRYLMEATLSGDFSYKFSLSDVNGEEKEANRMLNRIVEHFERLTKELRQNEVFLGRVIDLTDIGLILADAKGDIRLHNDSALRLLDRAALTHVCQIPDQSNAEVAIYKRKVTVDDRSFTLFTITDLRRQMQSLEVESWEKLTRVLTHEIMNSLTPIRSISETMSEKANDPEASEAFATIASSSSSLMRFVKNFREFSRLPDTQMRVIYVRPLLESIAKMAHSYRTDLNPSIGLTCFPPDLMLYTDESLLRQVLINIMKNAVEANAHHIKIEANVKADDSVEICISNDGDLISDEMAEQIFIPFFTTREDGSGIGLSLCRRIITHLGGTITLRTRPQTCFSVRI